MRYNVIALFKHAYKEKNRSPNYEERVLLIEAENECEAEVKALKEFERYSIDGIRFLGYYEINEIYPVEDESVFEVSSIMRRFKGSDKDYVSLFWENSPESCDEVGWKHVWYKFNEEISCCYNCQEKRNGQLWRKSSE